MSRAFSALLLSLCLSALTGCKSNTTPPAAQSQTPATTRPATAPAPFKLFHQTDNSLILVVPETTTDDQLAATVWQLRDAANAHTFDSLHLPQKFIDGRHPKIFFHLYRGSKCAPETYAKGPYPCGASYHGAADFSLGGFANPNATDGALIDQSGNPRPLWSAQ